MQQSAKEQVNKRKKDIRAAGGKAEAIRVDGPKLTALADGYLDLDLSRFPDVVRGIGDDLAAADGQNLDDMTVSVNAFLIELPGRLCLVDAGDGSRRGASLGHLRTALKRAGYEPPDVTDILMTHLHGDPGFWAWIARQVFRAGRVKTCDATGYGK